MIIGIQDEILRLNSLHLLEPLLKDKTTKANIIWATDAHSALGDEYQRDREITVPLITGENSGVIKNRARKALEQQNERTRRHAEVFTPLWVCKMMNDYADSGRFETDNPFDSDDKIPFADRDDFYAYVNARRLEITCGEAPYLVSRYDVSTGELIPVKNRVGLLDRKLRAIGENARDEDEWFSLAVRAFQSIYGYEFQGDNLLIARINLLMTFEEYFTAQFNRNPDIARYKKIANIISWNIWQMDGLTGTIPYCKASEEVFQLSLFDLFAEAPIDDVNEDETIQPRCKIYDWRRDNSLEFFSLKEGTNKMKFDFIIGNPPYQEESVGSQKAFTAPIYDKFLDSSYQISDRVEMIHPARFLFNAGSTSKSWNEKMLNDPNLKVLWYESKSDKVFPNTDIKGGIAITYHDINKNFGATGAFIPFLELNTILKKVEAYPNFESLSDIAVSRTAYRLTDKMHNEHPEAINQLSQGHRYDMSTNIFDRLPQIFFDEKPNDNYSYVQILGREKNDRVFKYVREDFINDSVCNFKKYKVFLAKANGSGALGEVMSTPLIGSPLIGSTESFLSIGSFDTEQEAKSAMKYIKSKFARVLLGILKTTQDITPEKWKYVPLQDFTENSDIDWSKSIAEIDKQLYAKYSLDDNEIEFIESHVKEMD